MRYAALATPLTYDYRVPNAGMSNLGFNLYTNAHKPLKGVTAQALSSSMSTGTPYVISASDLVMSMLRSIWTSLSLSVNAVTYNPAQRCQSILRYSE